MSTMTTSDPSLSQALEALYGAPLPDNMRTRLALMDSENSSDCLLAIGVCHWIEDFQGMTERYTQQLVHHDVTRLPDEDVPNLLGTLDELEFLALRAAVEMPERAVYTLVMSDQGAEQDLRISISMYLDSGDFVTLTP